MDDQAEPASVPLIPVTPHPDDDEVRRIGLGLKIIFAAALIESLPAEMLVLLYRLARVEDEKCQRTADSG